jgi:hypothetical protein
MEWIVTIATDNLRKQGGAKSARNIFWQCCGNVSRVLRKREFGGRKGLVLRKSRLGTRKSANWT